MLLGYYRGFGFRVCSSKSTRKMLGQSPGRWWSLWKVLLCLLRVCRDPQLSASRSIIMLLIKHITFLFHPSFSLFWWFYCACGFLQLSVSPSRPKYLWSPLSSRFRYQVYIAQSFFQSSHMDGTSLLASSEKLRCDYKCYSSSSDGLFYNRHQRISGMEVTSFWLCVAFGPTSLIMKH